jgi:hypothetical protein
MDLAPRTCPPTQALIDIDPIRAAAADVPLARLFGQLEHSGVLARVRNAFHYLSGHPWNVACVPGPPLARLHRRRGSP